MKHQGAPRGEKPRRGDGGNSLQNKGRAKKKTGKGGVGEKFFQKKGPTPDQLIHRGMWGGGGGGVVRWGKKVGEKMVTQGNWGGVFPRFNQPTHHEGGGNNGGHQESQKKNQQNNVGGEQVGIKKSTKKTHREKGEKRANLNWTQGKSYGLAPTGKVGFGRGVGNPWP